MYPDDDRNDRSDRPYPSEHNPFIAFRQMVDRQISTALRILSSEAGDTTQGQTPEDIHSRLFGIFGQPPLHDRAMSRNAYGRQGDSEEGGQSEEEKGGEHQRRHDSTNSTWSSFRPGGHGGGAVVVGTGPLLSPEESYRAWQALSPYSPSHLADDATMPHSLRYRWHAAFDDLLALHNGERMAPDDDDDGGVAWSRDISRAARFHEARRRFLCSRDLRGATWLSPSEQLDAWPLTVVFKRIDPSLMSSDPEPSERNLAVTRRRTEQDASVTDMLEEDMYRRFLDMHGGSSTARQNTPSKSTQTGRQADNRVAERDPEGGRMDGAGRSAWIEEAASKSEIISTVTQSHTTVDANGSTRTVRRFKKTFADGREECNEDVSEEPGFISHTKEAPTKKGSGWFWK